MDRLFRTLRTLRHLRPSQVYWRLRYRCERALPARMPRAPNAFVVRNDFPDVPMAPPPAATDEEDLVEQLRRGEFRHLHESRRLGRNPIDWQLGPKTPGHLWTFTLHYHVWAWRLARIVREGGPRGRLADDLLRGCLGDWITHCDLAVPGSRALVWNAYAIGTRLGWWCRLYHLLGPEGRRDWGPLESRFLESLWSQAAFLHRHPEWDLRANHLLRDAVGLAWAGRFFDGLRPRQWLETARKIAIRQAGEQVLPDGGHFERSPMYHVEVMQDFLALAFLLDDEDARQRMKETWQRMAEFLAWARHPDGQVPLFNDGGFNGAAEPAAMLAAGREAFGDAPDPAPRRGGRHFADFGLAVWHGDPWSVFFDVGLVGVDCQPGHAHADTLTFEASYAGRRLFVDPGTFGYDHDETRRHDRATASHNTVAVDAADSSEVWHVFRVGRRARPVDVAFDCRSDGMVASAGHTGYDHLPGHPRHRREIRCQADGSLTILDHLEGEGRHHIDGGLLIGPGWDVEPASGGWNFAADDIHLRVRIEGDGLALQIQDAAYHPEYGREVRCKRLCWQGVLQFPCAWVVRVEPAGADA